MIPTPTIAGSGDEIGRDGYVPHSGGAVFNTAIALGRLGVQTGLLTGLSSDLFGQQLMASLRASHVDTSFVMTSGRPTTLAFVQLTDGHATYSFFDENSAGRMLMPDDMPALPTDITALYFGGISLACEPGADAYAALIERKSGSRAVMLDPNIRPGFIRDIARYRARIDRMITRSDIVKVSDEDLNWLYPGPHSMSDKLDHLRAMGPSVVILTRGRDGASAYLADGTSVCVPPEQVKTVDTVGAGDTFNAGVLAKLSQLGLLTEEALASIDPAAIRQALGFGAKVAALSVTRTGANPPWAHEVVAD